MSLQSARDFLKKVSEDAEFRKGLTSCKSRAARGSRMPAGCTLPTAVDDLSGT